MGSNLPSDIPFMCYYFVMFFQFFFSKNIFPSFFSVFLYLFSIHNSVDCSFKGWYEFIKFQATFASLCECDFLGVFQTLRLGCCLCWGPFNLQRRKLQVDDAQETLLPPATVVS